MGAFGHSITNTQNLKLPVWVLAMAKENLCAVIECKHLRLFAIGQQHFNSMARQTFELYPNAPKLIIADITNFMIAYCSICTLKFMYMYK